MFMTWCFQCKDLRGQGNAKVYIEFCDQISDLNAGVVCCALHQLPKDSVSLDMTMNTVCCCFIVW